ncbi:MAG: hypothetical protein M8352_03955 [ANME-2 cluster archaeon]|nr:hypothetical protein [ANME-2 cluster archaeon]
MELFCPKWNKPVAEATCNICKDQCDNSVANPDNFIAKKLILDLEKVKGNRLKIHLLKKPIVELSKEKTASESLPEHTPEPVAEHAQESMPVHASKPAPEHAQESMPAQVSEHGPETDQDDDDFEAELNNMDFLKTEIEETFKERADMIIESFGLAHMRPKDKAEKEEEKT